MAVRSWTEQSRLLPDRFADEPGRWSVFDQTDQKHEQLSGYPHAKGEERIDVHSSAPGPG
jgi:hypothetical protein